LIDTLAGTTVSLNTAIGTQSIANDTKAFNFQGTSGQELLFDSLSTSGSANWRLIDPMGHQVFSTNINSNRGPVVLPMSGKYTLLVEGFFDQFLRISILS